jgi:hypothetical protein
MRDSNLTALHRAWAAYWSEVSSAVKVSNTSKPPQDTPTRLQLTLWPIDVVRPQRPNMLWFCCPLLPVLAAIEAIGWPAV